MSLIVKKHWHKIAFLLIMLYLSLAFATISLPLMWINYRVPNTHYYLFTSIVMFLGAGVFNLILFSLFHNKRDELKKGFPRLIMIRMLGWTLVAYIILFLLMFFIMGNLIYDLGFVLFLMIGGYCWFWILHGYIKVINGKDQENESVKHKPLLGKILFFSIILSLVLGYLFSIV